MSLSQFEFENRAEKTPNFFDFLDFHGRETNYCLLFEHGKIENILKNLND